MQVYNVSSVAEVKPGALQNALTAVFKGAENVPLIISTTPLNYDYLPTNSEVLFKNKTGCFGALIKRLSGGSKPEKDVCDGRKLIVQAGFHGTSHADELVNKGLSRNHESNAFWKGRESEGPGFYVSEDVGTAKTYAKQQGAGGDVVEVWLKLDSDRIDACEMQKTKTGDLVIRDIAYDKVFFVKNERLSGE